MSVCLLKTPVIGHRAHPNLASLRLNSHLFPKEVTFIGAGVLDLNISLWETRFNPFQEGRKISVVGMV